MHVLSMILEFVSSKEVDDRGSSEPSLISSLAASEKRGTVGIIAARDVRKASDIGNAKILPMVFLAR